MSIKKIVSKVEDYKKLYLEAQKKIESVQMSAELTEQAKTQRIAEIERKYEMMVDRAADDAVKAISDYQSELKQKRLTAIERGLDRSDQIKVVVSGIERGDYSAEMIRDIVEIHTFSENYPMLEAIRGAVFRSGNAGIKDIANEIPQEPTSKEIEKLEKVKKRIEAAPRLSERWSSDDWGRSLWKNGTAIDSLITFLLGLEEMDA